MSEHHAHFKWTTLVVLGVLSVILSALGGAQDLFGATVDAEKPRGDKLKIIQLNAKNVYRHYCAHCHGQEGKGDGKSFGFELEPKPRNFTDANYMVKDEDISKVITGGSASLKKSNLCPAWGNTFSEKTIKGLVAYIRAFSAPPSEVKKPVEVAVATPVETQKEAAGVKPFIVWPILGLLSGFFIWLAVSERKHIFS